jgi:L-threonylcarbamoyladenylate synthase
VWAPRGRGPLTLVLPARPGLPPELVSSAGVGVRRSPHALADALVAAFGRPVTASSANLSGAPPAHTTAEVRAIFGTRVHILDGGPAAGAPPSTVAQVDAAGRVTILRVGALDPARLSE